MYKVTKIFWSRGFIAAIVVGVPIMRAAEAPAVTPRVLCIASNGALVVRAKKCLASETLASMQNLPQNGAKGSTGAVGGSSVRNRTVEQFGDYQIPRQYSGAYTTAFCEADEVLLGGGCGCFSGNCNTAISATGPIPVVLGEPFASSREGWRCGHTARIDPDFGYYTAYAICAAGS